MSMELFTRTLSLVVSDGALQVIGALLGGGGMGVILTFALRWRKEDNRKMAEGRAQAHAELLEVVDILTKRLATLETSEQEREGRHRQALADADSRHHDCEVNCRKLNEKVAVLRDEITNLNGQIETLKDEQTKLCGKCGGPR